MPSLDGYYTPFWNYPYYQSIAPCMFYCDQDTGYNGCDKARCWCNKGNLDLRIGSVTRCASTTCTYANMNTQTDVDILSNIQVSYCADAGYSPTGMMLSTVEASTTPASSQSFASATGTGSRATRATGGPAATGGDTTISVASTSSQSSLQPSSTSSTANFSSKSSSGLSTAAKAGIGIGGAFCALLALLIIVLLFRRRRSQSTHYPPPHPNFQNGPPSVPAMAPTPSTPYSSKGPFTPPPLQQPMPIGPNQRFPPDRPVSPLEEKAAITTISRKEVPNSPASSTPYSVQPFDAAAPREVHGDLPPTRHEVGNDGQILNPGRGTELDGNQQPRYHESPQGYPYQYPQGQQYGGAYELGYGK